MKNSTKPSAADETESVSETGIPLLSAPHSEAQPEIVVRPPGPQSRTWLTRGRRATAPMGPRLEPAITTGISADAPPFTIVYASASGSNVYDVDGNRYVDLCAGFGSMLTGHAHPHIARVLQLQASRLMQALGDVYPADAKIALTERLGRLYPGGSGQVILGLSGADAVSAALKSAVLATGKPGVLAFEGAYHGLSYGPLAACGLRSSYREPFEQQLNAHVGFLPYPADAPAAERALEQARRELLRGSYGAVLVEPILGRGGCIVPPPRFLSELTRLAHEASAVIIADEIWTALGRSGKLLCSEGWMPDLVCLGKGLGGGLPLSACIGSAAVMSGWSRAREVVHTSTFAGAPLAAATAIATLDVLNRERLVDRSRDVGHRLRTELTSALDGVLPGDAVRGQGLMIGIDVATAGGASRVQQALLERGYIVSSGGGSREVLVLTPPLTIAWELLETFVPVLVSTLRGLGT